MTRTFLLIVGTAYLLLGLWCTVALEAASRSVGFTLEPGQGQSEFQVVYGGLELGLGLVFLWPLLQPDTTTIVLRICLIIHGCLVAFRTLAFVRFQDFSQITYLLAGVEWLIFGLALAVWLRKRGT